MRKPFINQKELLGIIVVLLKSVVNRVLLKIFVEKQSIAVKVKLI